MDWNQLLSGLHGWPAAFVIAVLIVCITYVLGKLL